jgi:cell division septum initiation protein DivIVA
MAQHSRPQEHPGKTQHDLAFFQQEAQKQHIELEALEQRLAEVQAQEDAWQIQRLEGARGFLALVEQSSPPTCVWDDALLSRLPRPLTASETVLHRRVRRALLNVLLLPVIMAMLVFVIGLFWQFAVFLVGCLVVWRVKRARLKNGVLRAQAREEYRRMIDDARVRVRLMEHACTDRRQTRTEQRLSQQITEARRSLNVTKQRLQPLQAELAILQEHDLVRRFEQAFREQLRAYPDALFLPHRA